MRVPEDAQLGVVVSGTTRGVDAKCKEAQALFSDRTATGYGRGPASFTGTTPVTLFGRFSSPRACMVHHTKDTVSRVFSHRLGSFPAHSGDLISGRTGRAGDQAILIASHQALPLPRALTHSTDVSSGKGPLWCTPRALDPQRLPGTISIAVEIVASREQ